MKNKLWRFKKRNKFCVVSCIQVSISVVLLSCSLFPFPNHSNNLLCSFSIGQGYCNAFVVAIAYLQMQHVLVPV